MVAGDAGADDQGTTGAGKCSAERLNGPLVGLAIFNEPGETAAILAEGVVDEGSVDDGIGAGGSAAQTSEVFETSEVLFIIVRGFLGEGKIKPWSAPRCYRAAGLSSAGRLPWM